MPKKGTEEVGLPVSITYYICKKDADAGGRSTSKIQSVPTDGVYATLKNEQLLSKFLIMTCALAKVAFGFALALSVSSCQPSERTASGTWKTYNNQRYGFEFPYPSNWVASPMPDNRDGQAFSDPQNSAVEIRAWAGQRLPDNGSLGAYYTRRTKGHKKDRPKHSKQNLTTKQGVTGELQVDINSDTSFMTLTLRQGQIQYNWQGRSPSQEFPDYYRFFYYIATEYRVPPPPK
ncbi:hypothetical protein [Microcoleus sp. FACHB-831]|uniref:hypothetical protein n=1 Tax=Microcoleus sp. FACHB-831 TaxID=2692827 RepID=UPI0018EFD21B|nr:hypothetical protein [Microcoleus sp. FACHB-831]